MAKRRVVAEQGRWKVRDLGLKNLIDYVQAKEGNVLMAKIADTEGNVTGGIVVIVGDIETEEILAKVEETTDAWRKIDQAERKSRAGLH